jgi:hypothetical protein
MPSPNSELHLPPVYHLPSRQERSDTGLRCSGFWCIVGLVVVNRRSFTAYRSHLLTVRQSSWVVAKVFSPLGLSAALVNISVPTFRYSISVKIWQGQAISLNSLTFEKTRPINSTETLVNYCQPTLSNNKSEDFNYAAWEDWNLSILKGYV